jgi:hypothetical protein
MPTPTFLKTLSIGVAVLLPGMPSPSPSGSPGIAASAFPTASATGSPAAHVPIASAADLAAYLRANEGKPTPFDALLPAARAEFLASLKFGAHGLVGFRATEVQEQLTEPQRYALLALFGEQSLAAELTPKLAPTKAEAQTLRRIDQAIAPKTSGTTAIHRQYEAFEKVQASNTGSDRAFTAAIGKAYQAHFAPYQKRARLRALGDGDIEFVYRAASEAAFYTNDPDVVRDMSLDLTELHRRHLAIARNDQELYDAFVSARMFADARTFSAAHPGLGARLPALRDETVPAERGPTELIVSADARTITRRRFDFGPAAQVIVVSQPFCHFCQGAVRDIATVPALQAVMKSHATWLCVPDGSIGFDAVAQWNAAHPSETMTVAYRKSDWPMFDTWGTPTFYFFEKDKLVDTIVGWPPGGRVTELERALHEIGLFKASDDERS